MIKSDCKFFEGEKPCIYKLLCENCPNYSKISKKILIIKMAAMGDVLRTTPILKAIKRKYPSSHISWICEKNSFELLQTNPLIDRVFVYDLSNILTIFSQEYDIVYCFDKMRYSASIATKVTAKKKYGFGLNKYGNIFPFNEGSVYSLKLGIDDELKFKKNRKTYQQIIYEMAELPYRRDEYILNLTEKDRKFAEEFFHKNRIREKEFIIGFNTGAGEDFANKSLKPEKFVELARKILAHFENCRIILLGENNEKNREIKRKVKSKNIILLQNCRVREFAAVIEKCSLIISGDTLGMHLAIALRKPVIAIFTSTCFQEIDLYGNGEKIVTPIECAPCYKKECFRKPDCLDLISVEEIYKKILKFRS